MWNRYHRTAEYTEPWLLRTFDRIRFFPVEPDELLEWRRDLPLGRRGLQIEEGTLRLADHLAFVAANQVSIQQFARTQQSAFAEERARWAASGEFDRAHATPSEEPVGVVVPLGCVPVESALHASVWQVPAVEGQPVTEGDVLVVLEAMKMEMPVHAPMSGHIRTVAVRPGQEILPGQVLAVIEPGGTR
jgi:urea carboxylase